MLSFLYFCKMQSLLIIGYVWPEPTATAAGSRMLQIIEQFQNLQFQVTFVSPAIKPETAFDLSTINVLEKSIELNHDSFDAFLLSLSPEIVLFDRFLMEEQFGWRVAQHCPQSLRMLDSEDLHFLRKARELSVKKGQELPTGIITTDEAKRELASIYRCDVTLTISEYEMDYLKKVYQIPEMLLWYLPFLVTIDENLTPSFEQREDFVFIGNFVHAPNWDAVLYLKQTIWPLIRKELPKANLHIYGSYPSQKVFQLQNVNERFLIQGRAENVNSTMQQAKVCLAPVRFGAGLKGKLIDAMQNETPFVTTPIGAEGMFGNYDFSACVGDTDQELVQKAVSLYKNKEEWTFFQKKGKQVLKERFDKELFSKNFGLKVDQLLEYKDVAREQNFIGAMLQHHTLKSTMYLSKWIAEKNKI